MKRVKMKLLTLVAVAVLGASFLASCGSPKTLEAVVESNSDVKKEIDQVAASSGMEVDIKENTCAFTYTINEELDEDMIKLYADTFKGMEDDLSSEFSKLVAELEEEAKIEGVVMKVTYKSASGDTIYEQSFDKNGVVK